MDCYRQGCKEACDTIKIKYCLWRLSEKQFLLKLQIGDSKICDCGCVMPLVKHNGIKKRICFSCRNGLRQERRDENVQ